MNMSDEELRSRLGEVRIHLEVSGIKTGCFSVKGGGKATEDCDAAIDLVMSQIDSNYLSAIAEICRVFKFSIFAITAVDGYTLNDHAFLRIKLWT